MDTANSIADLGAEVHLTKTEDGPATEVTSPGTAKITASPKPLHISLSEDDDNGSEEEDGFDAEDAGSIIGVSIGRGQSRLTSPSTPAAERSAAFDRLNSWGFFEGADEDVQEEVLRNTLENVRVTESTKAEASITPAPIKPNHQSQPRTWPIDQRHRDAVPPDPRVPGDTETRPRGSVSSLLGDLGISRLLSNFSFTNPYETRHPKHRPSQSLGGSIGDHEALQGRRGRSNSLFLNKLSWTGSTTRSQSYSRGQSQRARSSQRTNLDSVVKDASHGPTALVGKGQLRRTASDESFLHPPLSRHSTISARSLLGDETTDWEHIKQQVNSRTKALKDSLQESLPQMPNISLSNLRPELPLRLLRDAEWAIPRVGSLSKISEPSNAPDIPGKRSSSPPKVISSRTPAFDAALEQLTGDLVIMGGYRGSVLRSAEPPHRQLWVPVKVGLNIRKVNLEVGLDPSDEETMHQRIFPSGMLTHIGPVDMSRRLLKRLRNCKNTRNGSLRIWEYGYDWRLSPSLLSKRLIQFLEELPCNKTPLESRKTGATVIAHSLGGLITRHAVNQRPELFAGVVYAGTPQQCVNILGPLRNGDDVLLSSRVLTAQVNFSFRTSFLLLPESGHCFFNPDTKEEYDVDFFHPESWQRYCLSPCIAPAQPPYHAVERKSIFETLSNSFPSLMSASGSSANYRASEASQAGAPSDSAGAKVEVDHLVQAPDGVDDHQEHAPTPLATSSTIPLADAKAYLKRTLAEILQFKKELRHRSEFQQQNRYPPHALIYGTTVPTVYGARVASREAIKHSDAYDNLAFASGDGVVLARAAMMPRGYQTVEDGRVHTERGHVSMLGDLEAVGKCLIGLGRARQQGVGMGAPSEVSTEV